MILICPSNTRLSRQPFAKMQKEVIEAKVAAAYGGHHQPAGSDGSDGDEAGEVEVDSDDGNRGCSGALLATRAARKLDTLLLLLPPPHRERARAINSPGLRPDWTRGTRRTRSSTRKSITTTTTTTARTTLLTVLVRLVLTPMPITFPKVFARRGGTDTIHRLSLFFDSRPASTCPPLRPTADAYRAGLGSGERRACSVGISIKRHAKLEWLSATSEWCGACEWQSCGPSQPVLRLVSPKQYVPPASAPAQAQPGPARRGHTPSPGARWV